jgi:hypothetical protein
MHARETDVARASQACGPCSARDCAFDPGAASMLRPKRVRGFPSPGRLERLMLPLGPGGSRFVERTHGAPWSHGRPSLIRQVQAQNLWPVDAPAHGGGRMAIGAPLGEQRTAELRPTGPSPAG